MSEDIMSEDIWEFLTCLGALGNLGKKTIKKWWYNNDNKFNSNRHSLNPISTNHMFHVLSG